MVKAAIGIDIGGTNVQVGLIGLGGDLLHRDVLSVASVPSEELFFGALKSAIQAIKDQFVDMELDGIGIGSPGANIAQGTIENASNLPWNKLPIVHFLQKEFMIPACLTNDANLFALGEKVFGQASGLNDFIVLTLGTGVGAGIYTGGELLVGRDGLAGELGHMVVKRNGRRCHCGRKGCLERYVSANGLVFTAKKMLNKVQTPSILRDLSEKEIVAIKVAEAAALGDPLALKVFQITGSTLGEAIANIETCFNPEAVFLAGGLCKAGSLLFEPTIKSFGTSRLNIYPDEMPILPSSIPDDKAGMMGAAALVWDATEQLNRYENYS